MRRALTLALLVVAAGVVARRLAPHCAAQMRACTEQMRAFRKAGPASFGRDESVEDVDVAEARPGPTPAGAN